MPAASRAQRAPNEHSGSFGVGKNDPAGRVAPRDPHRPTFEFGGSGGSAGWLVGSRGAVGLGLFGSPVGRLIGLPEFGAERFSVDAEDCGGLRLVASDALKDGANMIAFDFP